MEFIAFTQRQDMTEQLALAHFKPSPLVEISERFLAAHPNKGIGVHYDILNSDRAFLPPRTRVWQQFKDEFDGVVKRFWTDDERGKEGQPKTEVSAREAMAALQVRVQGLIDRAADERRRRGLGAPAGGAA